MTSKRERSSAPFVRVEMRSNFFDNETCTHCFAHVLTGLRGLPVVVLHAAGAGDITYPVHVSLCCSDACAEELATEQALLLSLSDA